MPVTTAQTLRPLIDEEMPEVAKRCRDVREGYGLSLRRFAAHMTKLGYSVDWTTVQRWENGTSRIPADYILALHEVTRASPNWILTGAGPRKL